jgi:two-component system chemotaxis response regulator CheB
VAAPAALVVLGASAGGVDALTSVVAALPGNLDAAVLVVLHISPRGPSVLPEILERAGSLPAHHVVHGEPLERGHVYVAPPDRHIVVAGDAVHATDGPKENGCRPAIDVLFRSAAASYRDRTIAVVLSGMLDDGTAGAIDVKTAGGTVVVQDPKDAMFPAMPTSAATHAMPDHVRPLQELGPLLGRLVDELAHQGRRGSEVSIDQTERDTPSEFTCPDCGGTLFHDADPTAPLHFRCRVGHAYSPESLLVGKEAALEAALWAAVVALEERGDLSRRLYRRMSQLGTSAGDRYLRQAQETEEQAVLIRELLASVKLGTDTQEAP